MNAPALAMLDTDTVLTTATAAAVRIALRNMVFLLGCKVNQNRYSRESWTPFFRAASPAVLDYSG
jgi:hypothetical protein